MCEVVNCNMYLRTEFVQKKNVFKNGWNKTKQKMKFRRKKS